MAKTMTAKEKLASKKKPIKMPMMDKKVKPNSAKAKLMGKGCK